MNKKNELLLVLILMTLFGATGCSMMMAPPGGLHEDIGPQTDFKKSFSVVYNISYDEESFPYITIYYNVPYSGIIFLKGDSLFSASFRLNINIKHEEETSVNKNIIEILRTKDYSKTVSSGESFFGTFKENISTGKNEVLLMLLDKNSNRRYVWKREVFVPEIADTVRQD